MPKTGDTITVRQPNGEIAVGTVEYLGTNNGRTVVSYSAEECSFWTYLSDIESVNGEIVPICWLGR